MDLLEEVKKIFETYGELIKVDNFYFENHFCTGSGLISKVDLKFSLKNELTGDKIVFGFCPSCNKLFYNLDFDNNEL